MLPGSGNLRLKVNALHQRLFLDEADPVGLYAGRDIEVGPQPGVLLQPVFIHGFDPVDPAVPEGEIRRGAVNLVVILQRIHLIILRQRGFQRSFQAVIGRISDTQNVDAVPVQPVAELPVGMRKVWRDEHEIHCKTPLFLKDRHIRASFLIILILHYVGGERQLQLPDSIMYPRVNPPAQV